MADQPFLDRRGFLKTLFGKKTIDMTFFGVQVVFDAAGQEELRARIQALIDAPGQETPDEKRGFFKSLTSAILEAEPFYDYAYFEHVTGREDAEEGFEEWVNEIQAEMATEEDEVSDDIDGYHRMDNSQRYIVVTLLFLFEGKHPFYGTMEKSTEEIYTRAGVGELISSFNRITFEKVHADAVFLMPGSPEDGFSWSDFADEGWEHLETLHF